MFRYASPCRRLFSRQATRPIWPRLRYSTQAPYDVGSILRDNLKITGPISFATYMQMCLSFPYSGYYHHQDHAVFGKQGDFVTSPEISSVFGDMVGLWLLNQWVADGRPGKVRLVELGPGKGTLMVDILSVVQNMRGTVPPDVLKSIHLVETSNTMRDTQSKLLSHHPAVARTQVPMKWHDTLSEIPSDPETYTMVVAHEFFDALPVHILRKLQDGWREVMVAPKNFISKSEAKEPEPETSETDSIAPPAPEVDDTLALCLSPESTLSATVLGSSSPRFTSLPTNFQVEVSPESFRISRQIGELISGGHDKAGGCALIMDYGSDSPPTDSFRAFKNHKMVDVLQRPGQCDVTADVDFGYLREAVAGQARASSLLTQREFLLGMGLETHLGQIIPKMKSKQKVEDLLDAVDRLVDPKGMGGQYKFMGVVSERETDPFPFGKKQLK